MKAFKGCAAQGDLYLHRVDMLPCYGFKKAEAVDGKFIVAHSETGHHHVVEADPEIEYWVDSGNMMKAYLVVQKAIGAALEHLRSHDTHETILIPPGIYELRRQREYMPKGFRKVQD